MYKTYYGSPIGDIILGSDGENLVGLWIEKQADLDAKLIASMKEQNDLPVFGMARDWLDRYFAGEKPEISELPLKMEGSEFRRQVWEILSRIPYGQLTTYGEIAKEIAALRGKEKMSAQAVGGAVGANPLSIIIPCHRVVGANGNLTGYAGGIDLKIKLLEHECVDLSGLYVPVKSAKL